MDLNFKVHPLNNDFSQKYFPNNLNNIFGITNFGKSYKFESVFSRSLARSLSRSSVVKVQKRSRKTKYFGLEILLVPVSKSTKYDWLRWVKWVRRSRAKTAPTDVEKRLLLRNLQIYVLQEKQRKSRGGCRLTKLVSLKFLLSKNMISHMCKYETKIFVWRICVHYYSKL